MTKVLVIADTHNKLPPIICELARGADEIWHLGDVCDEWVLDELQFVGPSVTLVRGNCDDNYNWPLVCDLREMGCGFDWNTFVRRHVGRPRITTFFFMAILMFRATKRSEAFDF